mmetsp:Transcript_29418/g.78923  ORF Transcript_29418/g.78923 Transcript_29418/m.78923 type:complete len:290 (-) Transcript_29418:47-916(-)
MSYAGIKDGGLQPHVTEMARAQSDSLKVLVEEATRAEDARVKQARATKPKHRPAMEARFDRERQKEVENIQRTKEDHAHLLAAAMRGDYIPSGASNPSTAKYGQSFGSTAELTVMNSTDLAFNKEMYSKIGGDKDSGAVVSLREQQRAKHATHQQSATSRLSQASARSSMQSGRPRDRRDLLVEKKALLQRLHSLVSEEEKFAGAGGGFGSTGRSTNRSNFSYASARSGSGYGSQMGSMPPPLSPRSNATSASGATMVSRNAPVIWKHNAPSNIPRLQMREPAPFADRR